jgi:hypothetical protein
LLSKGIMSMREDEAPGTGLDDRGEAVNAPPKVQGGEADPRPAPQRSLHGQASYFFRGDEAYQGGAVGLPLGSAEAQAAAIQDPADHVLRKRSGVTSVYTSFTLKVSVARRFGGARQAVLKAEVAGLQRLEAGGVIKLIFPDGAYRLLQGMGKKAAKHAVATRDAMERNAEVLVEGQIPAGILQWIR